MFRAQVALHQYINQAVAQARPWGLSSRHGAQFHPVPLGGGWKYLDQRCIDRYFQMIDDYIDDYHVAV